MGQPERQKAARQRAERSVSELLRRTKLLERQQRSANGRPLHIVSRNELHEVRKILERVALQDVLNRRRVLEVGQKATTFEDEYVSVRAASAGLPSLGKKRK